MVTTTEKTFTPEEADSILKQLDAGRPTHVLAALHECLPSDIWRLWDERNRAR